MESQAEMSVFRGRGSLLDLVRELDRQRESKIDFVADGRDLQAAVRDDGSISIKPRSAQVQEFMDSDGVPLLNQAVGQIAQRVTPNVPTPFLPSSPARTVRLRKTC